MSDTEYPPPDDRLRHLIAQRVNCHVDTWRLAFFTAGAIVDDPEIRQELDRIRDAHNAGQPCGDRHCQACFTAATTGETTDTQAVPQRGELWSLLDWTFWGSGMGDIFREPLADTMLAAITPEQLETAEQLMERWHASGRKPLGRRRYEDLNAELKEAQATVQRVSEALAAAKASSATGTEYEKAVREALAPTTVLEDEESTS